MLDLRDLIDKFNIDYEKDAEYYEDDDWEEPPEEPASPLKQARKSYNRLWLKYFIFAVAVNGLQLLWELLTYRRFHEEEWYVWGTTVLIIYVIGFPLLLLMFHKTPTAKPEKTKMSFGYYVAGIAMGAFFCFVGAIIGTVVDYGVLLPFGGGSSDTNSLTDLMLNSNQLYSIVVAGILAPIFEELIFRKILIDHVLKYGEWIAILSSGLCFGLFHGNFTQFFFATFLGMFFAYIYIRTGHIGYTIGYHMIVNLSSSVVSLTLLKHLDLDKLYQLQYLYDLNSPRAQELLMDILPGLIAYVLWILFIGAWALAGLIIFIVFMAKKKFYLRTTIAQVPKGKGGAAAFGNVGFVLYLLAMIAVFVLYYWSSVSS